MTALRTRSTVRPEPRGAKRLRAQYGDRLVCIRYRYDTRCKRRYKTVELIVEERDWDPSAPKRARDRLVKMRCRTRNRASHPGQAGRRDLAPTGTSLGARV